MHTLSTAAATAPSPPPTTASASATRDVRMKISSMIMLFYPGYLEDRRPASNMDPYVVTSLLAETTILWEPTLEAEALAAQKLALQV